MSRILLFSLLMESSSLTQGCVAFGDSQIMQCRDSQRPHPVHCGGSVKMVLGSGEGDNQRSGDPSLFRERRPRGLDFSLDVRSTRPQDYKDYWGFCREHVREFPSTVDEVVNEAFSAVAGTLHNTQKLDPNIASNAMSKSIFTQRPTRNKLDAGRIGLEIDGAEHLFPEVRHMSQASGIRRVSLVLAAKLSKKESWESFEDENVSARAMKYRPVALCFNTIKQALAASHDLRLLKLEHARGPGMDGVECPYENILVQCVQDGIPKSLQLDRSKRRRRNHGLASGFVDASKGLLLVVQPTDFNLEHMPPGPAIDAVTNFQKLAAQATVEEVPIISLSPRFLSNDTPYGGWDQSGYQRSAIYGGTEPPNGPAPWVMRDFTPPVFCWIGVALQLGNAIWNKDDFVEQCHLARVSLTQSVMDPDHSWHIFVAKVCTRGKTKFPIEYIFLGSTRSSSGRPTRSVLKQILEDSWK